MIINKPKAVFIYGLPATGKFTVAKELQKKTGYKLCHNHMIIDLVFSLFPWKSDDGHKIKDGLYSDIIKAFIKNKEGIIFTHAHGDKAEFPSGMTSSVFIRKIEKLVESNDGEFCPVYLECESQELLERAVSPERKKYKKTNTKSEMKRWLLEQDEKSTLPVKDSLVIDNTNMSAKKVAEVIKNHFKL